MGDRCTESYGQSTDSELETVGGKCAAKAPTNNGKTIHAAKAPTAQETGDKWGTNGGQV